MTEIIWNGPDHLRWHLVPLDDLLLLDEDDAVHEQHDLLVRSLARHGQARPVLINFDRVVVGRAHLVGAARALGWTHLAVGDAAAEGMRHQVDQMSLVDEAARLGAVDSVEALTREAEVELINEASSDPGVVWEGLPEFVPASKPSKAVVSCDDDQLRDVMLDVLGVDVVHKGTRGTLSVWWPNTQLHDLSSLRFVDDAPT